ncbi:hypothetical protein C1I97_06065 [Streptomyces sp. NTH33]|uniref:hypothetical protein n=1 Tax=Streptomyces sp. NTH33 TaxID=1735453 RepID=UPI000DA831EE|nr:hypothetical protein [Streptomyces sp. NTH33]PZH16776.1 hypothetical protein C1I97_06065 [Streptomyces sp. NTH33]
MEEAADVVEAVLAAVDAVTAALPDVDGTYRAKLKQYALEVAGRTLKAHESGDLGPEPEAPRPQLALPPGPSAASPSAAPAPPLRGEPDSVDAVLAQLAKFEDEFGPLGDDDDD